MMTTLSMGGGPEGVEGSAGTMHDVVLVILMQGLADLRGELHISFLEPSTKRYVALNACLTDSQIGNWCDPARGGDRRPHRERAAMYRCTGPSHA